MSNKKETPKTLTQLKAWISGFSEFQKATWSPDAKQWKKIVKVVYESVNDPVDEKTLGELLSKYSTGQPQQHYHPHQGQQGHQGQHVIRDQSGATSFVDEMAGDTISGQQEAIETLEPLSEEEIQRQIESIKNGTDASLGEVISGESVNKTFT